MEANEGGSEAAGGADVTDAFAMGDVAEAAAVDATRGDGIAGGDDPFDATEAGVAGAGGAHIGDCVNGGGTVTVRADAPDCGVAAIALAPGDGSNRRGSALRVRSLTRIPSNRGEAVATGDVVAVPLFGAASAAIAALAAVASV